MANARDNGIKLGRDSGSVGFGVQYNLVSRYTLRSDLRLGQCTRKFERHFSDNYSVLRLICEETSLDRDIACLT